MTFELLPAGLGTFAAGIVVGLLLDDAYRIARTGKGFLMSDARMVRTRTRSLTRRATGSRKLGVTLVTIALAANMLLGILLIGQRAATERNAAQLEELASCLERYNRATGKARDERDDAARKGTAVEVRLWQDVRDALRSQDPDTGARALAAIDRYLASIEDLQDTRVQNPYPSPDVCARLDR